MHMQFVLYNTPNLRVWRGWCILYCREGNKTFSLWVDLTMLVCVLQTKLREGTVSLSSLLCPDVPLQGPNQPCLRPLTDLRRHNLSHKGASGSDVQISMSIGTLRSDHFGSGTSLKATSWSPAGRCALSYDLLNMVGHSWQNADTVNKASASQ